MPLNLHLQELLPHLAMNLSHRSQALRKATLTILSAFEQPMIVSKNNSSGQEQVPSQILSSILRVETQQSALGSSKSSPAAIETIQTAFEFDKIPQLLEEATVQSLLGFLSIRYEIVFKLEKIHTLASSRQ